MPDVLLDTGPVIRYLRDDSETIQLVERLLQHGDLYVSVLSRTEVLAGMREHERTRTTVFLSGLQAFTVDTAIADRAAAFVREYARRGKALQLVDALIAATTIEHDLALLTYDRRGFPMPELRLIDVASP